MLEQYTLLFTHINDHHIDKSVKSMMGFARCIPLISRKL
jgi:hypothetical protein